MANRNLGSEKSYTIPTTQQPVVLFLNIVDHTQFQRVLCFVNYSFFEAHNPSHPLTSMNFSS